MNSFKGKAIYNPSGKAQEYSYWACNFYKGCSNGCKYCYLKKGRNSKILGGNKPELKACFKNEGHAIDIFIKELIKNQSQLQKHGLFFTFTSDPFLKETLSLTITAINICQFYNIPVKILSKSGYFGLLDNTENIYKRSSIAIGFTLTGHDELEPNAIQNKERIEALKMFKELGYKTFASIEPIIDFPSSKNMIKQSIDYCDLFKIGLESGKKYSKNEAQKFISDLIVGAEVNNIKVYFKDSLLKCAEYERSSLNYNCCVGRDYNIFK
jgi:DNA repair photolyase